MFNGIISAKRMAVGAALGATLAASGALAQDFSYGEQLFRTNCAVCHGETGAGDGLVSELFQQQPRNLRMLSEENEGAFPFSEVYQAINGRREIRGHGSSEMPIWGDFFMAQALPKTIHPGVDPEEIVQGRILALTYYIQTLQQ